MPLTPICAKKAQQDSCPVVGTKVFFNGGNPEQTLPGFFHRRKPRRRRSHIPSIGSKPSTHDGNVFSTGREPVARDSYVFSTGKKPDAHDMHDFYAGKYPDAHDVHVFSTGQKPGAHDVHVFSTGKRPDARDVYVFFAGKNLESAKQRLHNEPFTSNPPHLAKNRHVGRGTGLRELIELTRRKLK